jgi:hypothetical protein
VTKWPLSVLPSPKLVAVLPLDVADAKLSHADQTTLEESIRTIAGDLLTPAGWVVLTGDTALAVLAENGIDGSRACEASRGSRPSDGWPIERPRGDT